MLQACVPLHLLVKRMAEVVDAASDALSKESRSPESGSSSHSTYVVLLCCTRLEGKCLLVLLQLLILLYCRYDP